MITRFIATASREQGGRVWAASGVAFLGGVVFFLIPFLQASFNMGLWLLLYHFEEISKKGMIEGQGEQVDTPATALVRLHPFFQHALPRHTLQKPAVDQEALV